MAETPLGQVTVSDSSNHQASGSGQQDGREISVRLGQHAWIKKGGNYSLSAGGNAWKAMCTGADDSGYYYFQTY